MLELIGVDGLTQWDVGRQVKVDKDVDMVHFSNRPYGYSKNVKVTDGVADVPDMFLTSCAPLRVWAYVGDFEKGYTKIEKIYEIKPKNRPEDYIYTPEEVKTWEKLQDEIGDLANLETEAKDNLVAAVNEAAKSGENDYKKLTNLPQINGVELSGNKTGEELGLVPDLSGFATKDEIPDLSGYATKDEIPVVPESLPNPNALTFTGAVNATYDGSTAVSVEIPSGGSGGTDISLGLTSAAVGQIIKVKAIDESGKPTEWEAADMPSGVGGVEIDISRQPDLILEVSETVVSLSISEINGEPIDTTEMVVLWEHPGGAQYVPNYFRFNNEVKNSTVADTAIANFNIHTNICPSNTTAAAILCRVKKINNGTYWYEFGGLQQNVGTIMGESRFVNGAPYRNNLIGETSIKEFYVYQSSNIQEGCKVSVWVK